MALTDSLVAYYELEDATDSHGSYDLTNTGSTPFNTGKIGNGADFTPNDALNNNSVMASKPFPRSFAGWAKFDDISSERTVFCIGDNSIHYYNFKCRSSDGNLVFRSNNNTQAADVDTGITVITGTWYHWVVVQNSTTSVTIYIDNVKTNDAATTFIANVDKFWVGYLGRSSVWYMDGIVDEVGIWTRAITSDEVSDLYNSGSGLAYPLTVVGDSYSPTPLLHLMQIAGGLM